MLQKVFRLKSPKRFRQTLRSKRLCSNAFFVVYARLHHSNYMNNAIGPQVGLIVSKKVAKHAVVRNRLKRRMREILRRDLLTPPKPAIVPFRDIVIVMRSASVEAPFSTLQRLLVQCFEAPAPAPTPAPAPRAKGPPYGQAFGKSVR